MQIVAGIQLVAKPVVDNHGDIFSSWDEGAAGEPVLWVLLSGVLDRIGADVGLGASCIAEPDGGTPEKAVGTI